MKYVALTVAFILELIAFTFFACVGFTFPIATFWKIIVAIVLFILVIVFWGMYMAPKAPKKLTVAKYYLAKTCIYIVSAYGIFALTSAVYSVAFIIAVFLDEIILFRHNLQS